MPNILNITEADFHALAAAANAARDAGDMDLAHTLDKLARKANAALSNRLVGWPIRVGRPLTWRDVPSTLGADFRTG